MVPHVIIDGNNLLYAMHEHAPLPHVGRETLVRIIDRWARRQSGKVTLVFDGPVPRGGLSKQMTSSRITVRFSAPLTADDVIVAMVHRTAAPDTLRIVTGDNAIGHEARRRRCGHTSSAAFVSELFAPPDQPPSDRPRAPEKPQRVSPREAQEWIDLFQVDDDEPLDDAEAMSDP